MQEVTLKITDDAKADHLISFLRDLNYVEVSTEKAVENFQSADFSDVFGKMQWKGSGLKMQQSLRDEWD